MKGVLFSVAMCSLFVGAPAPFHASCKITWNFGVPCDTVIFKLIRQIHQWAGPGNCQSGGEKCLYTLTSNTSSEIKAIHETPVQHYKDDLTFSLSPEGSKCAVKGYSTSEVIYAILDDGTNYCNLHNLVTGSGLNSTTGYTETTNNGLCTQYSTADCYKY